MKIHLSLAFSLCLASVCLSAVAQNNCPVLPSADDKHASMFTSQQEIWLGEVEAVIIEADLHLVPPPAGDDYVTEVGQKVLAALPAQTMKYRFFIYESPELNAFGLAGGRIYISSKMLSSMKSEDELAALLAHEIGHIYTHQIRDHYTLWFQRNGISSVTDKADIERKFLKLSSDPRQKVVIDKEEAGQDTADQVAIYAMVHAGYRPSAAAELFDRSTGNMGKTSNRFLDVLGLSNEANRRFRAFRNAAASIPGNCIHATSSADQARFEQFKQHMLERNFEAVLEEGTDSTAMKLANPLGSDLALLRFSQDGKYLLAVDDDTVTVLTREPLAVKFQVPAADIDDAWFTPDSTELTFLTRTMRVERWNLASQERTTVYEPSFPERCGRTFLAPNGKSVVCVIFGHYSDAVALALLDTETSSVIWRDDRFGKFGSTPGWRSITYRDYQSFLHLGVTHAQSPDGRILVASSANNIIAFDLQERKTMSLPASMREFGLSKLAFDGNDKLLVRNLDDPKKSALYSFPQGKRLQIVKLGDQNLAAVSKGDGVLAGPQKSSAIALLRLSDVSIVADSKTPAMDLWETTLARQTPLGNVQLDDITGSGHPKTVVIPRRHIGTVTGFALSPDGKYLAVSTANRSCLWDLDKNSRVTFMRPFDGAGFGLDGKLYMGIRKQYQDKAMIGVLDPQTGKGDDTGVPVSPGTRMIDTLVATWTRKPDDAGTMEVRSPMGNKLSWNREFSETPEGFAVHAGDRLATFWWYAESAGGRKLMHDHPEVKAQYDKLRDRRAAVFIEQDDRDTGAFVRGAALNHEEQSEAYLRYVERSVYPVGDYVVVEGSDGRSVVYHMPDGAITTQFFGHVISGDAVKSLLTVSTGSNSIYVVDANTGERKLERVFANPLRFTVYRKDGNELWAFTSDEVLHKLAVP